MDTHQITRFFLISVYRHGFACLLLLLLFTACKQTEPAHPVQRPVQRNIPIKVAIIYTVGGAQAVAREDFYLLNKDAFQIWKEGGLMKDVTVDAGTVSGEKLFKIYFLGDRINVIGHKKPSKFGGAVQPYIVKTVTTDFEGNAIFENVPEGDYYIYGFTETRSGYAVWSYKVPTNESKTILLDNKNAAFSW